MCKQFKTALLRVLLPTVFVSQSAPPKLPQRENGAVKHSMWFSPSEALSSTSQCWLWGSTGNVPVHLPDSAPTLTSEVVAPCVVSKLKYIKIMSRNWLQKLSKRLSSLCYKAQSHSFFCSTECCQTCPAIQQPQCSSFKGSILKAPHRPHWQTPHVPPARGMSNPHLCTQGDDEVKPGHAICPLPHGKPGCAMKFVLSNSSVLVFKQ